MHNLLIEPKQDCNWHALGDIKLAWWRIKQRVIKK